MFACCGGKKQPPPPDDRQAGEVKPDDQNQKPSDDKPIKVAILGSGIGALTTAWRLLNDDVQRQANKKFELTMYQVGFRLGGKLTTGRAPAEENYKIQDHGLHTLYGYYENAFKMVREVYQYLQDNKLLNPDDPLGTVDKAFIPFANIALNEEWPEGSGNWLNWSQAESMDMSEDPPAVGEAWEPSPWDLVILSIKQIPKVLSPPSTKPEHRNALHSPEQRLDILFEHMPEEFVQYKESLKEKLQEWIDKVRHVFVKIEKEALGPDSWLTLELEKLFRGIIDGLYVFWDVLKNWEAFRHMFFMADFLVACITGISKNYNDIATNWITQDDYNFEDWLMKYGMKEVSAKSPLVTFAKGELYSEHTTVAAGTGVYNFLRYQFTWKQALVFMFAAGPGDTLIVPIYRALKHKGVKFNFFHRVTNLKLGNQNGEPIIQAVEMAKQIKLKDPAKEYDPLINVPLQSFDGKTIPCWRSSPDWDQLDAPESVRGCDFESFETIETEEPVEIVAGKDYDKVVLGISIGAQTDGIWYKQTDNGSVPIKVPGCCMELYNDKSNPKYKLMLDNQNVTRSMSCQVWFNKTLSDMGWAPTDKDKGYMYENPPYISNYLTPNPQYDCWIDNSILLPYENWPPGEGSPKFLSYFTHVWDIPDTTTEKAVIQDYFDNYAWFFWPKAAPNKVWDYSTLVAPDGVEGAKRLDYQYYSILHNTSDYYVQTRAGTTKYRLAANESGYANLILTGDWTNNKQNIGGVESAVLSGYLTANATAGIPDAYFGTIETTKKK